MRKLVLTVTALSLFSIASAYAEGTKEKFCNLIAISTYKCALLKKDTNRDCQEISDAYGAYIASKINFNKKFSKVINIIQASCELGCENYKKVTSLDENMFVNGFSKDCVDKFFK